MTTLDRTGRTALVTGGTAGIGLAVARGFVEAGMQVIATGRSPDSVDSASRALGSNAEVIVSDTTDASDIELLGAHVDRRLGGLDVLVLNAGIGGPVPFDQLGMEAYRSVTDTNLTGPLFTAQHLGPSVRDGGAIVLTTSIGSLMARPERVTYDMSKASLRVLTRALAAHFLPRSIRVNAVSPGPIDTTVLERAGLTGERLAKARRAMADSTPMKRSGRAEEVARAVDFLAFDATYTTGAELPVDGGWTDVRS
jgi:NAD(P)-dependent dehydrogenase (short-subunit alcohol dehydrogenase family)